MICETTIWIIPIIIGLFSFVASFLTIFLLLLPATNLLSYALSPLFSELENLDSHLIEEELTPLIDEKISQFLLDFASQIPMGSMLLKGSLGQNLKEKGKKAVLELIPEIKKRGIKKGKDYLIQAQQKHWRRWLLKQGTLFSSVSGLIATFFALVLCSCCCC